MPTKSKKTLINVDEYEEIIVKYKHALGNALSEIDNIIDDIERSAGRKVVYYTNSRIKSLSSIIEKCNRKQLPLEKIEDIAGAKIVVLFNDDVEPICELLRNAFVVKQEDDYMTKPKKNGYRAIHLTIVVKTTVNRYQIQVPVEIQIKTALTDALWSMEHVVKYKNHAPDPRANDIITMASDKIDGLNRNMIEFRDYEKNN